MAREPQAAPEAAETFGAEAAGPEAAGPEAAETEAAEPEAGDEVGLLAGLGDEADELLAGLGDETDDILASLDKDLGGEEIAGEFPPIEEVPAPAGEDVPEGIAERLARLERQVADLEERLAGASGGVSADVAEDITTNVLAELEGRLESLVPAAAAKVIREEIAALLEEMK